MHCSSPAPGGRQAGMAHCNGCSGIGANESSLIAPPVGRLSASTQTRGIVGVMADTRLATSGTAIGKGRDRSRMAGGVAGTR